MNASIRLRNLYFRASPPRPSSSRTGVAARPQRVGHLQIVLRGASRPEESSTYSYPSAVPAGRSSYSSVAISYTAVSTSSSDASKFSVSSSDSSGSSPASTLPTGSAPRVLLDDVDVEIVGLAVDVFDDGRRHDHRLLRLVLVLFLDTRRRRPRTLVEVVVGRLPVRIAAVSGRRPPALSSRAPVGC